MGALSYRPPAHGYRGEGLFREHGCSWTSWSLAVTRIGDPYMTATVTHAANRTFEFSGVFPSTIRLEFLFLISLRVGSLNLTRQCWEWER